MYIAQEVSERIKKLAREQGIGQGELLKSCGCNTSTLNQMSGDKGISSFSLARIADALDCSVDYLLCRTENPNAYKTHASDVVIDSYGDEQLVAIIEVYKQLDAVGKAKLLVMADELLKTSR